MDKIKIDNTSIDIPPLRSLNDFLLESAKFQVPNFKDLDKWGNRVVHNLLYYQMNYFFLSAIIFLIVGIIHPGKMLMGMIAMAIIGAVFAYVSNEGRAIHHFKKKHPIAGVAIVIFGGCFITYTLGSLIVFMFGMLLPFSIVFVHASLRTRNIKNKMMNKIEGMGLRRTPMSIILEQLDDTLTQWIELELYQFEKLKNKTLNNTNNNNK